ncbi:endonuclease domain-containing protein [Brevundimonas sp.]|uniref:endonuclease domain-containing protein n=1 Tax=Brevundimonas sp. TaxID=1871086 RepID=UPI0028AF7C40|nr:endonuclease domain-containing protein [Brevundimonas sp.]
MIEAGPFNKKERIKPGAHVRARRLRKLPTWTEAKLWERLRKLDIRIRRQVPIGPYVVDFACLRARLAIEVDGGVHNRTDVALRDLARDEWLASEGYRVLRIDSRRIPDDLDAVIAEITCAIRLKAPLPLEGEGVGGWGEVSSHKDLTQETPSRLPRPSSNPPANTPTQPSPLEGEGS